MTVSVIQRTTGFVPPPPLEDPLWLNVALYFDWVQGYELLNRGAWMGGASPSAQTGTWENENMTVGAGLLSIGTDARLLIWAGNTNAGYFQFEAREWTYEVDIDFDTDPSEADAIVGDIFGQYNETGDERGILISLSGGGSESPSNHRIRVARSTDGTSGTETVDYVDLGEALTAAGGPYKFAFTRANNLESPDDLLLVHMNGTFIGSITLASGYTIHPAAAAITIGARSGTITGVGDIDGSFRNARFTLDIARWTDSNYDADSLRDIQGHFGRFGLNPIPRAKQYQILDSSSTTPAVTMPDNFTLTVGNVLLAFVCVNSTNDVDPPEGWTEEIRLPIFNNDSTVYCFSHTVDGTEGATVQFSVPSGTNQAWITVEYENAGDIEVSTGNTEQASSADPDELTFAVSGDRYLAIAVAGTGNGSINIDSPCAGPGANGIIHSWLINSRSGTNIAGSINIGAHQMIEGESSIDFQAMSMEATENMGSFCVGLRGAGVL